MEVVAQHRVGNRWFRTNLWLHRWSSLLATPFFLILCLTGMVLIFHEEIDDGAGDTAAFVLASLPLIVGAGALVWQRFGPSSRR